VARKKKRDSGGPSGNEWLTTYSDMVTLVLCFFAVMFNPDETNPVTQEQIRISIAARGMGAKAGGSSLSAGRMADRGNNVMSLPASDKGTSLGQALRKATSLFTPEVKSRQMSIRSDERGIIISLASDAFFEPASATLNMERSRDVLLKVGQLLASDEARGRKFRIEGHTDSTPVDPNGQWESNWELSTARALSVLYYLTGIGIPEAAFQVAGFADTVPISTDNTPEGMAYNRRVDIVILDEAHL